MREGLIGNCQTRNSPGQESSSSQLQMHLGGRSFRRLYFQAPGVRFTHTCMHAHTYSHMPHTHVYTHHCMYMCSTHAHIHTHTFTQMCKLHVCVDSIYTHSYSHIIMHIPMKVYIQQLYTHAHLHIHSYPHENHTYVDSTYTHHTTHMDPLLPPLSLLG